MFSNSKNFAADISSWDVSSVTDMEYVLSSSTSNFSTDLSKWNQSSIASTEDKFSHSTNSTADLS